MWSRVIALTLPVLIGLSLPERGLAQELSARQCESALERSRGFLTEAGMEISARFDGVRDGSCSFSAVEIITGDGRYMPRLLADHVVISGSGLITAGTPGFGTADIALTASDIRIVARTGDARTDYMLDAQSRLGAMQFRFQAGWSAAAKELRIDSFDLRVGEDSRLTFDALVKNVDLTTEQSAVMALTGFAVQQMHLELVSFGFFEQFLLPVMVQMLPDDGQGDFAATLAAQKLAWRSAINDLPDAAFPAPSRAALAALLSDLPNPRGRLVVDLRSASGFGPVRFMRFALTGMPRTVKELAPLFDDTRFDIDWQRGRRN